MPVEYIITRDEWELAGFVVVMMYSTGIVHKCLYNSTSEAPEERHLWTMPVEYIITRDEWELAGFVAVDRCGLVVRVPGSRSRGPGSISSATTFSEK
jgi:hypothetical protein